MPPWLSQIRGVLYKSWLIKCKSPVSFLVELLFPLLIFVGFAYIQTDENRFILSEMFNAILYLALSMNLSRLTQLVVAERESQMQDMMKILGLSHISLCVSWWIFYAVIMAVICGSIVPVIYYGCGGLINESVVSSVGLFGFYFSFCLASISFSLAISTFFNSARTAQSASFLIFFVVGQVGTYLKTNNAAVHMAFPQIAFREGLKMVTNVSARGTHTPVSTNEFTITVSMFWSSLVYFVLYWYLDQTIPRKSGFQKPWWFVVGTVKNCFVRRGSFDSEELFSETRDDESVSIQNITKRYDSAEYSSTPPALNDVSLAILPNQVTVLLGQNGAGKTTLINILTGMIKPSSGSIRLFGCSNVGSARNQLLGYCPQTDVLWAELTVMEHFIIFSKIKSSDQNLNSQPSQLDELISLFGLSEKIHAPVHTLSGGMKRRVSSAIAFLGNPKFVLLDEPSSGLDPLSRRQLWHALTVLKQQSMCILLSTHYMDEAEYVGDQISILARGILKASGSVAQLKQEFACDYSKLEIAHVDPVLADVVTEMFNGSQVRVHVDDIIDSVQISVKEGTVSIGSVLSQLIPILPRDQEVAVSSKRLESVFLKICSETELDSSIVEPHGLPHSGVPVSRSHTMRSILWTQIKSIIRLRFLVFRRNFKASLFHQLLPVLVILLGLLGTYLVTTSTPAEETSQLNTFSVCILVSVAFSSVAIGVGDSLSKDKKLGTKAQLVTEGLSIMAYWIGNFVADTVEYFVFPFGATMCLLFVLNRGDVSGLSVALDLSKLFTLLLTYGPSVIAQTYCFSVLISSPTLSQIISLILNMIIGSMFPLILYFLRKFEVSNWFTDMAGLFRLVPAFDLGEGLVSLAMDSFFDSMFKTKDAPPELSDAMSRLTNKSNEYSADSASQTLLVVGAGYLVLTLLVDYAKGVHAWSRVVDMIYLVKNRFFSSYMRLEDELTSDEDDTVATERNAIRDMSPCALRMCSVSKQYPGSSSLAVSKVPLAIPSCGEVFGLLGQNSAGKSTLVKLAIGELLPSEGSVELCGHNTRTDVSAARRDLGYCPQIDSWIPDRLTVVDVLGVIASIKGIAGKDNAIQAVTDVIETLGLSAYSYTPVKRLSGGYKRRVSLGVAMIGDPKIHFLDEPTCGMDPVARRSMWSVAREISARTGSVVLTTHSMEEAEAVSTRIGIMSKGKMVCIGTVDELRKKFSNGLEVWVVSDQEGVLDRLAVEFEHQPFKIESMSANRNSVRFVLTCTDTSVPINTVQNLQIIFRSIEKLVNERIVKTFTVSQNSLEQVFNAIAIQDQDNSDS